MCDGQARYFHQTVKCIRGTEARAIAKWETQGWEVVSQTTGKARTTLELRRLRPKPPWRLIGAAAALLVVAALVATLVGVLRGGSGGDEATDAEPAAPTQSAEPTTAPEPTESPSPSEPSDFPDADKADEPDPDQPLTAENSPAFAALLRGNDCGGRVQRFARANAGRTIQFDGSISAFAPHGDNSTRFDILLGPGDKGPNTTVGGVFKFEDVGISDLNLTGAEIPNRIGIGDRLRLTATVDRYAPEQCILFLDPVETAFR